MPIPAEFYCVMTGQVMENPYTLQCGHTFETHAIIHYFEFEWPIDHSGPAKCPCCTTKVPETNVGYLNLELKNRIEKYLLEHHNEVEEEERLNEQIVKQLLLNIKKPPVQKVEEPEKKEMQYLRRLRERGFRRFPEAIAKRLPIMCFYR